MQSESCHMSYNASRDRTGETWEAGENREAFHVGRLIMK